MGFVPFTFVDLIDIILVAVIMYWIYRMTKGTNAPYILSGIIAVYLLWVVVRALNMELLSTILGQLISVGAIALIIVFRRARTPCRPTSCRSSRPAARCPRRRPGRSSSSVSRVTCG